MAWGGRAQAGLPPNTKCPSRFPESGRYNKNRRRGLSPEGVASWGRGALLAEAAFPAPGPPRSLWVLPALLSLNVHGNRGGKSY